MIFNKTLQNPIIKYLDASHPIVGGVVGGLVVVSGSIVFVVVSGSIVGVVSSSVVGSVVGVLAVVDLVYLVGRVLVGHEGFVGRVLVGCGFVVVVALVVGVGVGFLVGLGGLGVLVFGVVGVVAVVLVGQGFGVLVFVTGQVGVEPVGQGLGFLVVFVVEGSIVVVVGVVAQGSGVVEVVDHGGQLQGFFVVIVVVSVSSSVVGSVSSSVVGSVAGVVVVVLVDQGLRVLVFVTGQV